MIEYKRIGTWRWKFDVLLRQMVLLLRSPWGLEWDELRAPVPHRIENSDTLSEFGIEQPANKYHDYSLDRLFLTLCVPIHDLHRVISCLHKLGDDAKPARSNSQRDKRNRIEALREPTKGKWGQLMFFDGRPRWNCIHAVNVHYWQASDLMLFLTFEIIPKAEYQNKFRSIVGYDDTMEFYPVLNTLRDTLIKGRMLKHEAVRASTKKDAFDLLLEELTDELEREVLMPLRKGIELPRGVQRSLSQILLLKAPDPVKVRDDQTLREFLGRKVSYTKHSNGAIVYFPDQYEPIKDIIVVEPSLQEKVRSQSWVGLAMLQALLIQHAADMNELDLAEGKAKALLLRIGRSHFTLLSFGSREAQLYITAKALYAKLKRRMHDYSDDLNPKWPDLQYGLGNFDSYMKLSNGESVSLRSELSRRYRHLVEWTTKHYDQQNDVFEPLEALAQFRLSYTLQRVAIAIAVIALLVNMWPIIDIVKRLFDWLIFQAFPPCLLHQLRSDII